MNPTIIRVRASHHANYGLVNHSDVFTAVVNNRSTTTEEIVTSIFDYPFEEEEIVFANDYDFKIVPQSTQQEQLKPESQTKRTEKESTSVQYDSNTTLPSVEEDILSNDKLERRKDFRMKRKMKKMNSKFAKLKIKPHSSSMYDDFMIKLSDVNPDVATEALEAIVIAFLIKARKSTLERADRKSVV